MTKGMELEGRNEAPEAPKTDSQEVGEIKAEPLEAPEVIKRVEQVTFDPEAVVQREGDYTQAEAIQDAFVKVIEEPELAPAPGGLMPASIELGVPEAQEVQPALSDASDIQPPTSGLPGLSEVGLEAVGDKFVPLGESVSSISPVVSDLQESLTDTPLTLEQALSIKPTVEAEIPEASVGEVRDVPFDPVSIVSKPESGEETQAPVMGTAEQTMDLESFVEKSPEIIAIEAVANAKETATRAENAAEAYETAEIEAEKAVAEWRQAQEAMREAMMVAITVVENNGLPIDSYPRWDLSIDGAPAPTSNIFDELTSDYVGPFYGYGSDPNNIFAYLANPAVWPSEEAYEEWCTASADACAKTSAMIEARETAIHAITDLIKAGEMSEVTAAAAEEAAEAALAALTPLIGAEAAENVLSEALNGEDVPETGTSETEPPAEEGVEAEPPVEEGAEDPSTDQPEDSQHNHGHGHDHG